MGNFKQMNRGLLVAMGISLLALPALTSTSGVLNSPEGVQAAKDQKRSGKTTLGPRGRFQPESASDIQLDIAKKKGGCRKRSPC